MDATDFGRYKLLGLIGEGGMGRVYTAYDTVMRRDVAIKVLPPELAMEPGYADRFRREAYTAAKLTEPHIIPIHEAGEIDGRLYLVMPVIKGTDLHTVLRRDGPMAAERAVRVIEQLAAALDAAHEAGLVHRDVKPSNALLTSQEFAYLIDFGVVQDLSATRLSRTGMMVGTCAYMAPERFKAGTVDARADVYALACVLYECLTAQLAYPGDSLEQQMAGHLTIDPPKPSVVDPAIPPGFDDVIAHGMAKDPARRYQAAHELAAAARHALNEAAEAIQLPSTRIEDRAHGARAFAPSYEISLDRTQLAPKQTALPTPMSSRPAAPVSQRRGYRITIGLLGCVVALFATYATVELFSMRAASNPGYHPSHILYTALVAVPILAGLAAFIWLRSSFRDRTLRLLIRFKRDHIVVCGLTHAGQEFVRQLCKAGYRPVVVEANVANPHIRRCRDLGVPVIVGDARLQPTLRAAGVTRAARLLAVTVDNSVNAEIVARASGLVSGQSRDPGESVRHARHPGRKSAGCNRKLRCLAQIDDPDFCILLRLQESNRGKADSALDFINLEHISARLLLEQASIDMQRQAHIVVAHLDALGRALIFLAAHKWHRDRDRDRDRDPVRLRVTVVDDRAEQRLEALLGQYPILGQVCEFSSYSANVRDIRRLAAHTRERAAPPISRAYVTADGDELTIQTALVLRHELDGTVPVVAALLQAGGVASLLHLQNAGNDNKLTLFNTLEMACTPELVEGGSFEAIAQAVHDRYREMECTAGRSTPPWSELDGSVKEANRSHARDVALKLHTVGCEITPLRDWNAEDFAFTAEEVEKLAIMEHDRWWKAKLAEGWSLGDKDPEHLDAKTNPYMVPFRDLPPEIADYDRDFVKAIPVMLASVALQVIRGRISVEDSGINRQSR